MRDSLRQLQPGPEVSVVDVSARDGLQAVEACLAPGDRASWIRRILEAGVVEVEAGSFVRPDRVPQMAGACEVYAALPEYRDRLWFLVPNPRGLEEARRAGVRRVVHLVSATESHSRSNLGRSVARVLDELDTMLSEWGDGTRRISVSMAWSDPDEGVVAEGRIVGLAAALHEIGFEELTLCDTYGRATPDEVAQRVRALRPVYPPERIGLHLHDASGLAARAALAGAHAGVRRFEGSLGGLGGCPFAAGSRGNLDLETLVGALEAEGFRTGIDPGALAAAREANLALLGGEQ